jgi:hypothetical protein
LDISPEFLGAGDYTAEILSDAPDAALSPTHTVIGRKTVNRSGQIKAILAPGGGQAIRLRPGR